VNVHEQKLYLLYSSSCLLSPLSCLLGPRHEKHQQNKSTYPAARAARSGGPAQEQTPECTRSCIAGGKHAVTGARRVPASSVRFRVSVRVYLLSFFKQPNKSNCSRCSAAVRCSEAVRGSEVICGRRMEIDHLPSAPRLYEPGTPADPPPAANGRAAPR